MRNSANGGRNSAHEGRNSMVDRELNDNGDFSGSEGDQEYSDDGSYSSGGNGGDPMVEATNYSMVTHAHVARLRRNACE